MPRSQMRVIKAGVPAKDQKRRKGSEQEIGDGEIGKETVINQQRNAGEKR